MDEQNEQKCKCEFHLIPVELQNDSNDRLLFKPLSLCNTTRLNEMGKWLLSYMLLHCKSKTIQHKDNDYIGLHRAVCSSIVQITVSLGLSFYMIKCVYLDFLR